MAQKCPHCGADLPEEASFCPHCARTVHRRKAAKVPVPLLKRVLLGLLVLVIVSAVAVGLWLNLKPSTYDEYGQVNYTAEDGTIYQVLLASGTDRFTPEPQLTISCEADGQYRMPSRLYINNSGSGEDANETKKLSKLGGTDWEKAKTRAKKAVKDLAKGLIQLYAQRQRQPGFAFPRLPLMKEFEDEFEYAETDDQLRCIEEIKRDMERPSPWTACCAATWATARRRWPSGPS